MSGFATARQKMVDGQVRPSDVTDIRILDAMLAVPREAFVPPNQRALAYLDLDLDISEGASAKRFLIKPLVIAKMLQAAEITETDKVLVAGCATGYTAALVARLAGQVTATESDPAKAGEVLAELGLGNVTFRGTAAAEGDRPRRRDRSHARPALPAAQGRRPAGRGFRRDQAAAGHDRDPVPW
jgi:protein-L-isoaspartate(D-aspartate) O-methyltransferase